MIKQNASFNAESEEKKSEEDEEAKVIQDKLDAHARQKMNKENENLILMTQNYHKYYDNTCECSTIAVPSKILNNAKTNWMSSDKLNELRRKAHEAVRMHKVFILKGYFHTVRKALTDRGWVRRASLFKLVLKNHCRSRKLTSIKRVVLPAVQASYSKISFRLYLHVDLENQERRKKGSAAPMTFGIFCLFQAHPKV